MKQNFKLQNNVSTYSFRIAFAIIVPMVIIFGAYYLYNYGNPLFCVFYKLTGFYCAGCGSGRALFSLLHFDILKAINYNILTVISLPLVTYYLLKQYVFIVFGRDLLPLFDIRLKTYNIIMIIIIVFWIIRNINIFPFSLLAP